VLEGEELDNLKSIAGSDAICYAKEATNYWQCVCGKANALEEDKCKRCDRKQNIVLAYYANKKHIDEEIQLSREKEANLKQLETESMRKPFWNYRWVWAITIIILLAVFVGLSISNSLSKTKMTEAEYENFVIGHSKDMAYEFTGIEKLFAVANLEDSTWRNNIITHAEKINKYCEKVLLVTPPDKYKNSYSYLARSAEKYIQANNLLIEGLNTLDLQLIDKAATYTFEATELTVLSGSLYEAER
jgi:hypothetical protein